MQLKGWAAMLAAAASLCAAGARAQEASYLSDSASPFGDSGVSNADAATVQMPRLAYTASPTDAADFDKYYYFHRPDTDFATAYADVRECDGYARGLQSGIGYTQVPYPYAGTMAGAVGGAIGDALAMAIFGSAEKRRLRRVNMRTCMHFKGYARYGLTKDVWEAFNFEEGLSGVEDGKRDMFLRQQALVASSAKPETKELGAVKKLIVLAALAASLAAPALARDKEPPFVVGASVKDAPAVKLDPNKAYILLRTDMQTPLQLMRVPSAADQARYDRMRADAFAEARAKYAKRLKNYQSYAAAHAKDPAIRVPEKPVEPTEANFEFTPFGLLASVAIGPINRFAKAPGGGSTYLQEVTPGEYRIYGPVMVGPNAVPMGACFCMGSVKFEARPGEITDMGAIQSKLAKPRVEKVAGDSSMPVINDIPDFLGPAPASMPLDPRLASFPIRRADYHPVGKLPNYFGLTLGRIPEMPGVLRYDRDRIVDLTRK